MSESGKAVFLSYASQDAEAAKRICEALRAAGVEVWFDQNELVGGDAWDQKIRKQIGSCALFVPIISANTQARAEGYFRLEWKLADRRTDLIGKSKAFLLPVCIDDTRDADADVPDSFLAVQWTKLPSGEATPAFVARVQKLLDGGAGARELGSRPPLPDRGERLDAARERVPGAITREKTEGRGARRGLVPAVAATAVLAAVGLWFVLRPGSPPASAASPVAAPVSQVSEARGLALKAKALIENGDDANRETYATAEELLKRALALDSTDSDVLAIYAQLSVNYIRFGYDTSDARVDLARRHAERAVLLAPESEEARFALSYYYYRFNPSEAEKRLREDLAKRPDDRRLRFTLGLALRQMRRRDEALEVWKQMAELPGSDAAALAEIAGSLNSEGRLDEAEAALDRALALRASGRALLLKINFQMQKHGDLAGAQATALKLPAWAQQEDRGAYLVSKLAMWSRKPDVALRVIQGVPRDYWLDNTFTGPKGALAGQAHWQAGRTEAARNEWRAALQLVERMLAQESQPHLLFWRAWLQAALGDRAAAEESRRLFVQTPMGAWPQSQIVLLARIDLLLGRETEVLDALTAYVRRGSGRVRVNNVTPAAFRHDPDWDTLRDNPRFAALLEASEAAPVSQASGPASTNPLTPDAKSIAVLPFANLSDDKESGYFADGVHEDVLTNLAKIAQLKVIARTSVMEYRATTKKIPQIAQELGVAYLLEGSVRRAGNRVRVVCQLIDGRTGQHVLTPDPFDRDLADIFAIQSEIAQGIATKLQAVLAPTEKATLERAPTANLAAYELSLQARQVLGRSHDQRAGEEQARPLLERAVQLDPNFALAWQGLGYLHLRAYYRYDQSESRRLMARQAIDKARELEPRDGEILALQTNYCIDVRDLPRARQLAAQLEREHPSLAVTWHVLARLSIRDDNIRAALEYYRRARSLDPRNVAVLESLTTSLATARRYEEAQAVLRDAGDLVEKATQLLWSRTVLPYYATGSTREMDELAGRLAPDAARGDARALSLLSGFASIRGDAAELVRLWEQHGSTITVSGGDGTFTVAVALLIQGQPERARVLLEKERARYRERLASRPDNIENWFYLAATHAVLGDREGTAAVKREMLAANPGLTRRGLWRYEECMLLAWLGDKDAALADLADRLAEGPAPAAITVLRRGLRFRPLQGDPRFEALLADPKNSAPFF